MVDEVQLTYPFTDHPGPFYFYREVYGHGPIDLGYLQQHFTVHTAGTVRCDEGSSVSLEGSGPGMISSATNEELLIFQVEESYIKLVSINDDLT